MSGLIDSYMNTIQFLSIIGLINQSR